MTTITLQHETKYHYDRAVVVNPQTIRLRPAPHCLTPISNYSLRVLPVEHTIQWRRDAIGNEVARVFVPNKTSRFEILVDLTAELQPQNPFDFALDHSASKMPFEYSEQERRDLQSYLHVDEAGPLHTQFCDSLDVRFRFTVGFLVELNDRLSKTIEYQERFERGVQSCEETLDSAIGSCRDTAWLFVQILRRLGLASRFVSGYLIQLMPADAEEAMRCGLTDDVVDFHAWTEVYLPGAGWVGFDPTSGMLASEGHIPLAIGSTPKATAPIVGRHGECDVEMAVSIGVKTISKPQMPSLEPLQMGHNEAGLAI